MSDRGKWSQAGVPHKDWECIEIEDLDTDRETCEMCEEREIRFVHYMKHPNYPHVLACGCHCAGEMEGSSQNAERRDKVMRNEARRCLNFLKRAWKASQKGNSYIDLDGFNVTIFKRDNLYKAVINRPFFLEKGHFIRRSFESEDRAKLAAFDEVQRLRDSLGIK